MSSNKSILYLYTIHINHRENNHIEYARELFTLNMLEKFSHCLYKRNTNIGHIREILTLNMIRKYIHWLCKKNTNIEHKVKKYSH